MVLTGTTGVVLPWEFEGERVSNVEIRKLNSDDTLVVDMSYDGDGAHARMKKSLGPDAPGMRVRVRTA